MKPGSDSTDARYVDRLARLQTARWKRVLDVQRPYRMHLRSLSPGFVLDVGCGIERNLEHLRGQGIGVDLDPDAVAWVRGLGHIAHTVADFASSADAKPGRFDSLLVSHVLEHVDAETARTLVATYLPYLAPGGRVIVFTPQECGFKLDPTHVRFFDEAAGKALADALGLTIERQYSFPFPRIVGRVFPYNEFVLILRKAS